MKQGWEVKKLGGVCEIINGFAFKSQLFREEGENILRISNIQNGYVDLTDIAHFSKDDYPKTNFEKYAVLPNDIVVALSGATTGKFGINKTGKKLYLNQRVAICRESSSELNHLFLLYYLQTQSKSFLESAEGVAQPNLSTEQMKQYDIAIPPREEQERIVEELDCLSGVIEKKREQLKQLDALAQSIFYQMFGDPITNEKGWEVKKWKDMLTIVNGKNQKTVENLVGAYPIYGSGGIMGYADKYLCPKNTIIIGRKGNINKPIFVKEPFWNVDTAFGLIADNIHIAPSYLFFYCRIFNFEQLNKAVTIPSLTKSDLLELNTPCPPLALQQEFADKIEAIEKQKELIKKSISETETLFNARMDYYFN